MTSRGPEYDGTVGRGHKIALGCVRDVGHRGIQGNTVYGDCRIAYHQGIAFKNVDAAVTGPGAQGGNRGFYGVICAIAKGTNGRCGMQAQTI